MDSSASVSSCSWSLGEISSAKPVTVHKWGCPFLGKCPLRSARESSLLIRLPNAYGPAGTGRLVDAPDYREGLASFFEIYGWLAALPYGVDEVLDLVAVCHGEAGWVRTSAGSGLDAAIPFHDLCGLVPAPALVVRVSLPFPVCGMEIP